MATYYGSTEWKLCLVSPTGVEYRLNDIATSFKAEHVDHPFGTAEVTARPWDLDFTAGGDAFHWWSSAYHWLLRLYVCSPVPVWEGPVIRSKVEHKGTPQSAFVTLKAKAIMQHALERRVHYKAANAADLVYTATPATTIIAAVMEANFDGTVVTPPGYGAADRTDFGPYWTVTAVNPSGTAGNLTIEEQVGNGLRGFVEHVAQKGDCALTCTPSGTLAWELSAAYPYLANDYSKSRPPLRTRTGGILGFSAERSWEDIANTLRVKGDGSGTGQSALWIEDAASLAEFGTFEKEVHLPKNNTWQSLTDEGTSIKTLFAAEVDAYTIEGGVASATFRLFDGYNRRDKVAWVDDVTGMTGSAIVRGWGIEGKDGVLLPPRLRLGTIVASPWREIGTTVPNRANGWGGSRFWNSAS